MSAPLERQMFRRLNKKTHVVDIKAQRWRREKRTQAAKLLKAVGRSCSFCRVSLLSLPTSQLHGFQSSFNTHPEGKHTVCPRSKAQLKTLCRKKKKRNTPPTLPASSPRAAISKQQLCILVRNAHHNRLF